MHEVRGHIPHVLAVESGACGLDQLAVGHHGQVVAITGDTEVRRRLLEMGFCNGVSVQVVRRAPLGDPIEFRLRGYCLSLRREQGAHVRVVPVSS